MNFLWRRNSIKRQHIGLGALAWLVFLLCALVWAAVYIETPPGLLTFAVLDVGEGDSLFIQSSSGVHVLIDGGPDDSVLRELPKAMPLFDHSLDAVVLTYPDPAHISGLLNLLKRYYVGAFIEPGIEKHSSVTDSLEKEIADEKIPRYVAERGMLLDLGGGAYLQVLSSDADVPQSGVSLRLVYGSTSVLLMPDAGANTENNLLGLYGNPPAGGLHGSILKVGEYGSDTSTGAQFLAAVEPSLAVISVGAQNAYGFPSPVTLQKLKAQNISVFRTDQDGTIIFKSDGQKFWRVK